MNVKLSKAQKIKVLNSEDIYAVMQQVLLRENKIGRNQEHFWVVGLDNHNTILFVELVALGAHNRVSADPSDVFRMAIYKMAIQLILVHNHPSGNLDASTNDLEFTDKLLKVGQLLHIEVLDHLVITEKGYSSFADAGVMEKLKKSGLFEITGPERQELEEWKIETEKKKAEKEKAKAIAKKMKAKGYDDATIKELTGLSLGVISEL